MSIEALVAEVRPTITNHAALAAADQLYFGDRRAASDAKPETSHGHHRGHSHTNHGKNHSGDKVKQAIHDAKATLNKTGNNRHRGASHQESQEVAALRSEVAALKLETTTLKKQFAELRDYVSKIGAGAGTNGVAPETTAVPEEASASKDDDFDLFGSEDEDDEEKKRITEERLKAYAEKKAKKGPGPVAKSNIIFDVKPWDDTIDIKEIEKNVREITTDGLVWGASKILPVAFGINKLQIMCVVEDAKVSTDWLEEQITGIEDLVQSIDVVAFNKV